jgi:hypothetical protein
MFAGLLSLRRRRRELPMLVLVVVCNVTGVWEALEYDDVDEHDDGSLRCPTTCGDLVEDC